MCKILATDDNFEAFIVHEVDSVFDSVFACSKAQNFCALEDNPSLMRYY